MTQEEAIKIIKECKEKGFKHTFYTVNEYDAALDMAIKALRREDTFLDNILKIIDITQFDEEETGVLVSAWNDACKNIRKGVEAMRGGTE